MLILCSPLGLYLCWLFSYALVAGDDFYIVIPELLHRVKVAEDGSLQVTRNFDEGTLFTNKHGMTTETISPKGQQDKALYRDKDNRLVVASKSGELVLWQTTHKKVFFNADKLEIFTLHAYMIRNKASIYVTAENKDPDDSFEVTFAMIRANS